MHELVKRAREAKRELAAIEREIADVVVETTPSIVDTEREVAQLLHDTDYRDEPDHRELGSHIPAAVTGRQPGNHIPATVAGPIRSENYRLPPQVVAVPAKHPVRQSTAIDEELKKIEKQFEQRLLEEKLLPIERSELRRLAETKQLLEESCRPSTSYTARQPEESYRPAVSFVPVRPEGTTQAPRTGAQNYAANFPSFNESQVSARRCTSRELPPFSGDPKEWMAFIANYEHSTAICGYTNDENMLRLQACLRGKAREAVASFLLYPDSIPEAIEILKECYGRPELVVNTLMANIRRMPPPKDDRFDALVDYGVAVRNFCASITGSGLHSYFDGGPLLEELVDKLPPYVRLNWYYYQNRCTHTTLAVFNDWVKELVRAASRGVKHTSGRREVKVESNDRHHDRKYAYQNVHSTGTTIKPAPAQSTSEGNTEHCVACHGECQALSVCSKFLGMSVHSRWTLIKRGSRCRTCLRKHQGACDVHVLCGMHGCERRHHRLLHSPSNNQVQPDTQQESN